MGEAARRRPGPAPSLSRDEVAAAALDVMTEEGLSAVSFRSVSRRLGVNPMALYTYVRDKDELLAAMYDRVSGEIALDLSSTAPAADQLVDYYQQARRVLLHNADLYRLVRRPDLPGMDFHTAERLCELLAGLGLDPRGIASVQAMLLQHTIGNALFWAAVGAQDVAATAKAVAALDPDQYPHLHASMAVLTTMDAEEAFVQDLRTILAAVTPQGPAR